MFATPSAEQQRRRALRSARPGPLKDYLQTPFPDPATPVGDLRLLAVDLETTGLHPKKDRLLSIGFVPVDGLTIDLSGARRFVVQSGVEVGQSAAIHGLTDDTVAAGTPIEDALPEVLEALRGRVLLAHYTDIEERFLSTACERVYGSRMPVARIDTLELHRRLIVGWGRLRCALAFGCGPLVSAMACRPTEPTSASSTRSPVPSSISPRSPRCAPRATRSPSRD